MNGPTRVKICCIRDETEAAAAIAHGASALGLVSEMPSGPGIIAESTIARIVSTVPPPVSSFLLTCRRDAASIVEQQRRCGVDTIQLVDRVADGTLRQLRAELPGVSLVQVVHVIDGAAVEEAAGVAADVDAILLDSGNPDLPAKELGGTGRTHDWEISRRIRDRVDIPVFLAGGLHAGNVGEAIRRVRPYGIDVCSGVRTDDRLDTGRLKGFFEAVRAADEQAGR